MYKIVVVLLKVNIQLWDMDFEEWESMFAEQQSSQGLVVAAVAAAGVPGLGVRFTPAGNVLGGHFSQYPHLLASSKLLAFVSVTSSVRHIDGPPAQEFLKPPAMSSPQPR